MIRIEYPFNVGGMIADRAMWMATENGEVVDYHKKGHLIAMAKKEGKPYQVIRRHRDGTESIVQEGEG